MKVPCYWPALLPAIEKAGHEPVLMPVECRTCERYEDCVVRPDGGMVICLLWKERKRG